MAKRLIRILISALLLLLPQPGLSQITDDCGTPDPTAYNIVADQSVSDNTIYDWISLLARLFFRLLGIGDGSGAGNAPYQLDGVPIVYHILPNNDNGGVGAPSLTEAQIDYATQTTNRLFEIYDKQTKQTVQFARFVHGGTVVHDVELNGDCGRLSLSFLAELVRTVPEWQFKFHAVVCESNESSGTASLPEFYPPDSPLHNLMRMDYRAYACFDDEGNFLCEARNENGDPVSHTRWWRTRSATQAHELGHLFGLMHTQQGGCLGDDGVDDTPVQMTTSTDGCAGLLPYDRDRDLYDESIRSLPNAALSAAECSATGGEGLCPGNTCASCCTALDGSNIGCPKYVSEFEVVDEHLFNFPHCCNDPAPLDTCPFNRGIDPLNNVMSYIPDYFK